MISGDMEMEKTNAILVVVALLVGCCVGAVAVTLTDSSDDSGSSDYWYYLYFSDGDSRNGWYSGSADNANDGFANAMDTAGFSWTRSNWGYIGTIDGEGEQFGWYLCQYVYEETDSRAQSNSILNPSVSNGTMAYSNGWFEMFGYDDGGFKLSQFSPHIFFFSIYSYDSGNYVAASPVSVAADWMNSGPFIA